MSDFITAITQIAGNVDTFMYTYILVFLLIASGLYFSVRTKFVQVRSFKEMIKCVTEQKHVSGEKSLSSFQALMISTASRVGTGNIAGVATAIATGGPGAVFWMWVMATINASSAFIESTLAQIFKIRGDAGSFRGGPAYYIQQALGKRWLGILFSISLIICFAYGFNGLQAYNAASAFEYYISDYSTGMAPFVIAILLTAGTAIVIFGGGKSISNITSIIVPIMAFTYMAAAIFITGAHISQIPQIFGLVLASAFDVQAIFGGFAGSVVVIGIKRGLYSNEAGMGSAPNAAASASVSHPVKQGLVQTLSVFIDTMVICTCTALMILVFYVNGDPTGLNGMPLAQAAMQSSLGEFGIHFITFSIVLFAYSSLVGNYYYAESNIKFIKDDSRLLFVFRLTCLVAIFLGTLSSFDLAWSFADIAMGVMAFINLIAIFQLGKWALKALADYREQKRQGLDPVFVSDSIEGMPATECWHETPDELHEGDQKVKHASLLDEMFTTE